MNSIIKTLQTDTNLSFAKNIISNMQNGYELPRYVFQYLDAERKAIYWKLWAKHIDLPDYWSNDEVNLFVLKQMIKFCPNVIKDDYVGFCKQWKQDTGTEHKIDCPKIRRQINKILA